MANTVTSAVISAIVSAWASGKTLKVVLIDADYTYSSAHANLSDIPSSSRIAISDALTGVTANNGVLDANDTTLLGVSGDDIVRAALFVDTGNASTSTLVAQYDSVTGLPLTPAGDVAVTIHGSGLFRLVAGSGEGGGGGGEDPPPAEGGYDYVAALPEISVSTTMPTVNGSTFNVANGGDLQAALDSAAAADGSLTHEVVLAAGASFTGNFELKPKSGPNPSGTGWIIVRSGGTLPNSGTRAQPSNAPQMAKIISANSDPALYAPSLAHHYRLIGLELARPTNAAFSGDYYAILRLGDYTETTTADQAEYIVVDRCYIHGYDDAQLIRGIELNSNHTAVIDSYISECHATGSDSQAACGWAASGPYVIHNNYLSAAGENFMFGGATPEIWGTVPSDITFTRNHCYKPPNWLNHTPIFSVKNLFELKCAQRILIEENVFEGHWDNGESQIFAIVIKSSADVGATGVYVNDVTFRRNLVRNAVGGLLMVAADDLPVLHPTSRVTIRENLFYDIGTYNGTTIGRMLALYARDDQNLGLQDITIRDNTFVHNGGGSGGEGYLLIGHDGVEEGTGLVFEDNVATLGEYQIDGNGSNEASLQNSWTTYTFAGNLLVGSSTDMPAGTNVYVGSKSTIFTDEANDDYTLKAPYTGTAGADVAQLLADLVGVT